MLNETILSLIQTRTSSDNYVYQVASTLLDIKLDSIREEHGSNVIEKELAQLKHLERRLTKYCDTRGNMISDRPRTIDEDIVCSFFMMEDLSYEATIDENGFVKDIVVPKLMLNRM